jgi:5S rRNA maturation endonuclease (ribonuclease M5)
VAVAETAYERLITALEQHGSSVCRNTDEATAQCPAHDDRNPSLSLRAIEGQALVHCFAGCDTGSVLGALGLQMADLYDNREGARYRYDDGRLVIRSHDRDTGSRRFVQYGITKGKSTQLYRLSKVAEAVAAGVTVCLVEGEKDVHALESLGVVATTAPQGAGSFHLVDVSPLNRATVVAVVDQDDAGLKWARQVRSKLHGVAQSVRFYAPKEGKDAADHVAAGYGVAQFQPYELPEPGMPPAGDVGAPVGRVASQELSGATEQPMSPAAVAEAFGAQLDQPDLFGGIEPAGGTIWDARPVLRHIHRYAYARGVSPRTVLGHTLLRVIAATPPQVVLPAIIGEQASLNLWLAVVDPSGAGKSIAAAVSRHVLTGLRHGYTEAPVGSGEGLSDLYMEARKRSKDEGGGWVVEQHTTAALVSAGEVDTLTALSQRSGSTLLAQLRHAAMGEQLGFSYRDREKRLVVPEHRYRLCLWVGGQPARCGPLLSEAEAAAGTPQRFVWLPAADPGVPDSPPECPAPLVWKPPRWVELNPDFLEKRQELEVCGTVRRAVWDNHVARQRGEGDALDAHALLTREKVAAGFAILDGRAAVTEEDWELAGVVMAWSDVTRASVQRVLANEAAKKNLARGHAEAQRSAVVEEHRDERRIVAAAQAAKQRLAGDGELSANELRRRLWKNHRDYLPAALDRLVAAGEVEAESIEHHGQSGMRYRLRHDQ